MTDDPWEWLSLIDADGPFLSKAALKSFYRSGLPRPDASVDDVNATFVREFERWSKAWSSPSREAYAASRDRWVEAVLRRLLDWSDDLQLDPAGFTAHSPNSSVDVTAWAVLNVGDAPAALVTIVDRTDDLRGVGTDGWSANSIDRMSVLLRQSGISIGIVTDGRWWALVSAARDVTTASGVWDASLWRVERASRDAFFALASFTSIAGGSQEKRLPLLFAESVASAEQITEALGDQVRRAVELVLQSMSDTHVRVRYQGEESPLPSDPKAVYEGAVTMLMRIVFLLFAEERGLLPEHQLYRASYAIADIRDQLQQQATESSDEALDHSWEAWHRLLAASNAVYGGASFEDMRMPAYGGSLFDPERFPWLQATDAQGRLRVRLTDRAMLAVLRAVQTIEDGAMHLSFRDLDVEQIGYVYEGLLGYSAEYVNEVVVGLQGKGGFEPEIPLRELEAIAGASVSSADFGKRLTEHLKKTQEHAKPRTENQLARGYEFAAAEGAADARTRLRHALLGDDELAGRLQPFHGLIRDDLRGFPYVVPTDGLVMTESAQRANTGTHYTPRSLAEEVVVQALEPLVYSPGPLDTENSDEWVLKSSAEILDLKVADIAAGSGAFLVAAARYLGDRLIEAVKREGFDVSNDSDLKRWAVREIVARCLYGADINGMAVEMCKLSLWLISMDPGKPFSFVDDRVFHGNSLLGVTTEAQLKAQHIYPERREAKTPLRWFDVDKDLEDAARFRRELTSGQVDDGDRMRSTRAKRALLEQSWQVTAKLRSVADGIIATGLLEGGRPGRKLEERYDELADALRDAYPTNGSTPDRHRLDAIIAAGLTPTVKTSEARWKPLHWILEVPDVIHDHGGFDAVIGNPPFFGGQKLSSSMGDNVREWLVSTIAHGARGSADLVTYFIRRALRLTNGQGVVGLVATNSVAQGDSREVGLAPEVDGGVSIWRAVRSRPWSPSSASVFVSLLWLTSRTSLVGCMLDGNPCGGISASLEVADTPVPPALQLRANAGVAFKGVEIGSRSFLLTPEEAERLLVDPRNTEVVLAYPDGKSDINGSPTHVPSRWVIDLSGRSEQSARSFAEVFQLLAVRAGADSAAHAGRFWDYRRDPVALRTAMKEHQRLIVYVQTSSVLLPQLLPSSMLYSKATVVFKSGDPGLLAALSSSVHVAWAMQRGSTMKDDFRYTPTDVFEPFPLPPISETLSVLGAALDSGREEVMRRRRLGLTALYNMVNSPEVVSDEDVDLIRTTHVQIDEAVMEAYGWTDIPLDHGFHTYRQMERWTVSPAARVEILDRLIKENHRRAAVEAQSAPAKGKRSRSFEESAQPEGAMF